MNYTDDSFAAMLLTMALTPDREEYARPLNAKEFKELETAARQSSYGSLGKLLSADISGLMIYLHLSEEEALRVYTLLNRSVQLTYAMENLAKEAIEIVTCYDDEYPQTLTQRLKDQAPVFFYRCGDPDLLIHPAIAIVGIGGLKTDNAVRAFLKKLVSNAVDRGYSILTGGEPGVSYVGACAADACGGRVVDIVGGDMIKYLHTDKVAERVVSGRGLVMSTVHPEALFTIPHATARNKLLFALAQAVFVFNTDGRRGEQSLIQSRACPNVYAWNGFEWNHPLIYHGATAFDVKNNLDFDAMCAHWQAGNVQQMSLFDLLNN